MSGNYFNLRRFWWLLKLEVFKSRKGILLLFVITFGMLFFAGLLLGLVIEKHVIVFQHEAGYAFSLLTGGYIVSSLAFNDLGNTLKRYKYLMLPVSTLERFVCMWLLTTIGWVILYTIIYTLYSFAANAIGQLIFSKVNFTPFDPLQSFSFQVIRIYLITQGIFLVGAAHFRGYVFPKTLFVLILSAIVIGTITYFSLKEYFLADHYCEVTDDGNVDCGLINSFMAHGVWNMAQWLFWWVLAPLTWVITYLGLKGQEV